MDWRFKDRHYLRRLSNHKRDARKWSKFKKYDRFIPRRSLINFEHAFSVMTSPPLPSIKELTDLSQSKAELQRQLKLLSEPGNQQSILYPRSAKMDCVREPAKCWPCTPRSGRHLALKKVLDLPNFNTNNLYTHTMDWSAENYVAVSCKRQIVVGLKGEADPIITYENDLCTALLWSPSGRMLAIGTQNGIVQVWDHHARKMVFEDRCCSQLGCSITVVSWHPTAHHVYWACTRGTVSRRRMSASMDLLLLVAKELGAITQLKFSPGGGQMAVAGQNCVVRVWNVEANTWQKDIYLATHVCGIAWHPWRAGLLAIAEGGLTGELSMWNIMNNECIFRASHTSRFSIEAIAFSPLSGEMIMARHFEVPNSSGYSEIVILSSPYVLVDSIKCEKGVIKQLVISPDKVKIVVSIEEVVTQEEVLSSAALLLGTPFLQLDL